MLKCAACTAYIYWDAALLLLAVIKPYINVLNTFANCTFQRNQVDLLCGEHLKVINNICLVRGRLMYSTGKISLFKNADERTSGIHCAK